MVKQPLKNLYLGAIKGVAEKDGRREPDLRVYLINTSDEVKTLELVQSSFQGDSDGILDLGHSRNKEINIPAKGFVQIDRMNDEGQLDFTTAYTIKIGDDTYFDQIDWLSFSGSKLKNVPILNKEGFLSDFNS